MSLEGSPATVCPSALSLVSMHPPMPECVVIPTCPGPGSSLTLWMPPTCWLSRVLGQGWVGGRNFRKQGEDGSTRLRPPAVSPHCHPLSPETPYCIHNSFPSIQQQSPWQRRDAQQQVQDARHVVDMAQSECLWRSRSAQAKVLLFSPCTPPNLKSWC